MSCIIEDAPHRLHFEHSILFSVGAKQFLEELINEFDAKFDQLMIKRAGRRVDVMSGNWKPAFRNVCSTMQWSIDEIPKRLQCRKLDLGDVSPANTISFCDALYADVQGIQVDFDDGHCPTWRNTVQGLYNVTAAVHHNLQGGPSDITIAPILMMRPRAFNMIEHHCMVNGKEVPGALFDFAILMYHNAKRMQSLQIGPYFYLSKIEDSTETELWNEIFTWSQNKLNIPQSTIKACVLIENILAAYCMEDILFSIRNHAIGLNCGIWDYSASIISKFGNSSSFVIPDRSKYVNMSRTFLKSYMELLINTCHKRGALATGGMAAHIMPPGKGKCAKSLEVAELVKKGKLLEIKSGVDGFMVHDVRLVDAINEFWHIHCPDYNQLGVMPDIRHITPSLLLEIPQGGVTINGLRQNITVALLFIYHWLTGCGIFFYNGVVEDSATAEISRSQLWQWIRFATKIEDQENGKVTHKLVYTMLNDIIEELKRSMARSIADCKRLSASKFMLLEIVTSKYYIEYITTYLNDSHKFRSLHNKSEGLESKL